MAPSVWEFEHYKSFLKAWIAAQPHRGHGSKATLARAAQCQTAYISQVILGDAQLSLEQAARIAAFLELGEEETHFFLLLVQTDRAGTEELRRYFSKQRDKLLRARAQLKGRVEKGAELSLEAQTTYFSSWIYPAIHLASRMPALARPDRIAAHLDLSPRTVEQALEFLESAGLVTRAGGRLAAGPSRMHLPHDSPLVAKHHVNWRLRAIRDVERAEEGSVHYSSVVTLGKQDAIALREQLLKSIEAVKGTVRDSPDELLYSFCLDFFEV